jgi:hypothetical protein
MGGYLFFKTDLRYIICDDVEWIELALDTFLY